MERLQNAVFTRGFGSVSTIKTIVNYRKIMAGSPPAGRLDLGISASPNADYMITQMTAKSRIDREKDHFFPR